MSSADNHVEKGGGEGGKEWSEQCLHVTCVGKTMLSHTHLDIIRCGAAKPAHLKDVHMLSTTGNAVGTVHPSLQTSAGRGRGRVWKWRKGSGGRQWASGRKGLDIQILPPSCHCMIVASLGVPLFNVQDETTRTSRKNYKRKLHCQVFEERTKVKLLKGRYASWSFQVELGGAVGGHDEGIYPQIMMMKLLNLLPSWQEKVL